MKKKFSLIAIIFFLLFSAGSIKAASLKPSLIENNIKPIPKDSIEAIQKRVLEIQAMDPSQLNAEQRQQLRHELKGMYKELKSQDDGGRHTNVYISVGGLVVIILILILILR
jgi:hypothetical protein